MDASGELAEFSDRLLDLVLRAREDVGCGPVGVRGLEAERDGECHEPLLRAVVEVAFDAAPLGVGGRDDPAPRGAHLRELRPHLCREALVLEHERRGRTNRFHERRLVEQRRIVNERGDLFAPDGHRRDGTVRSLWQLDRPAGGVDIATVAEAVRDVERGVAECPGEPLAHRGRRLASQLDNELGRLRSTEPRPADSDDDPNRNRHGEGASDRLERRHARVGGDHPAQPHKTGESRDCRRKKKRRLRASCRAAQGVHPLQDEEEHPESDANAGDRLRSVDRIRDTRMGGDR